MLRRLTIRKRLALVLWGVAALAFAVAGVALVLYQNLTLERRARQATEQIVQIVATATETAVAFEDPVRAQEMLATLRANSQILEAAIFLADGRTLATYGRAPGAAAATPPPLVDGVRPVGDRVELTRTLNYDARLVLVMSRDFLNQETYRLLWMFGGGVLVLLVITFGQMIVLQPTLIRPLANLAQAAEVIRTRADYGHRVPAEGEDEIARLGQGFNAMMDAIRQRDESLREKTTELDAYFTNALDLLCISDTNGCFRRLNTEWMKTLGYSLDELIGKQFLNFVHPDDREETRRATQRASREEIFNFTNRYRCKDGSYRWIEWRSYPAGPLVYAVARDITERRRVEEQLRVSERNYREVFNATSDAIFIHEVPSGHLVDVNQSMIRMYGYASRAEAIGSAHTMTVNEPPYTQAEAMQRLRRAMDEGPQVFEWLARRKGGERFWVEVALRRTTIGGQDRVLASVRDITQRRQAEHELRKFQYSIDRSSDAIFWINRDARFAYVNEQACRSLDYTRDELMQLYLWDIDPIYPRKQWSENWERYQPGHQGGGENVESIHRRKDGTTFPVEVVSNHIWFGDEELHVAVVRDITDRKDAESALKYRADFERIVLSISTQFIALPPAEVDAAVNRALAEVGRFAEVDRCYLFAYRDGKAYADNTHEWCAEGIEPQRDRLQGVPSANFPALAERVARGEPISIARVADLPDSLERRYMEQQGIRSVILVPMICGGDVLGFLGLTSLRRERIWSEDLIDLLQVTGNTIASALERQRAEAALRESEERFRALVETSQDWIWEINLEGVHTFSNPASEMILGYSVEEFKQLGLDLLHPDDRTLVDSRWPNWVEQKTGWTHFLLRWRHRDGSFRHLDSNAVPAIDADGKLTGFRGVDRDVTEQMQAATALRESEERFRVLVETSPDWVWGADEHGIYNYSSPRIKDLLGYTPEEVLGRTPFDLMPDEEAARVKADFAEISRAHLPLVAFENVNRHKEGRLVVLETSAVPIFDAQGVFRGYRGVDRDITERKQAEAALRLSQSQLLANLENTPNVAVQWYDEQGRVLYWNPASEKLYGWKSVEAVGKTLDALILSPEETAEFQRTLADIGATCKPFGPYEAHVRRRDGGIGWVLSTIFGMPLGERRTGFVCMDVDITERKHAEEALRESQTRLEAAQFIARMGNWEFDDQTQTVAWSKEMFRLFGLDPAAGEPSLPAFLEMLPLDDRVTMLNAKRRAVDSAEQVEFEFRFNTPQNTRRHFIAIIRPVKEADGTVRRLTGTVQDITERKQSEIQVRRLVNEQRTILNTTSVGISFIRNRKLEWINPAFGAMFGYSVEEAQGMDTLALYAELEVYQRIGREGYARLAEGIIYRAEIQMKKKDGSLFWCHLAGQAVNPQSLDEGSIWVMQDITDRKQAEEDLRQSQASLESAQAIARIGSWDLDLAGGRGAWSREMFHLFDVDPSAGVPPFADFLEMVHPEDRAHLLEVQQRVVESGEQGRHEFRTHPDRGPIRHFSAIVQAFKEAGAVRKVGGTVQDITDRKRSELALEQSLALLVATLESTADGILVVDSAGQIAKYNQRFAALWRLPREVLDTGNDKAALDYVLDQLKEPAVFLQKVQDLYAHPEADSFDLLEFKDGRVFERFSRPQLVDGRPVGRVWSFRDVTERKRAEEALRESEQKFRTLFEHMAEGVALHEVIYNQRGQAVDYRLLDVNPAYGRHTGLELDQVRGRLASELYGLGVAPYLKEWAEVARTGAPHVFETYFEPMAKHFHISAVSPKRGFFATVFEDITRRKHNEEELRRKNEELERFTYTVSHDLKSPLITIKGFTGALQQDLAAGRHERLVSDLKRIADATDKMAELLNDLLELSRIGRIVNPPSDVAFGGLVEEVLELLSGPIRKRGVKIVVQPNLPPVHGDRRRLAEVLQNLVENSLRFMGKQRHPRIEIGMQEQESARVFFVRDNGLGIEPRYHETVFGLFNKLDAKSPGTGIGLALVRRIIEVHGGRIWVESQGHGQGATFCFTLPSTPQSRKETS